MLADLGGGGWLGRFYVGYVWVVGFVFVVYSILCWIVVDGFTLVPQGVFSSLPVFWVEGVEGAAIAI